MFATTPFPLYKSAISSQANGYQLGKTGGRKINNYNVHASVYTC